MTGTQDEGLIIINCYKCIQIIMEVVSKINEKNEKAVLISLNYN